MDNKKKLVGAKMVVLSLFFLLSLFVFSTSYARTTLTSGEAEYLYNYCFQINNAYSNINSEYFYLRKSGVSNYSSKATLPQNLQTAFMTAFNNINTLEIDKNKTIFWVVTEDNALNGFYLYYGNFNNGKYSNLPHLYLKSRSSSYGNQIIPRALDDNKTEINYNISKLRINFTSNSLTLTNYDSNFNINSVVPNGDNYWYGYKSPWQWNISNVNNGDSLLQAIPGIVSFSNTNAVYINWNGATFFNEPSTRLLQTYYINTDIEPNEPSGDSGDVGLGNITNSSGENTGNINLQPIQNTLNNIENKIPSSGDIQGILSGETGKIIGALTDNADNTIDNTIITSGDIKNSLGFEIADDPYSNFWVILTNNLKTALLGSKRSIDISFQNRTWTICLDEYLVLPAWLIIILTPISTAFFTWVLVRQWKHIFDKLSSGNIDSILKDNSEERNI